MEDRLLLCTDLDRTLIPNGPQPASSDAPERFAALVSCPEVRLCYVSGRDRALVQSAIEHLHLPVPDFVVADVGTTIYDLDRKGSWVRDHQWEIEIAADWVGKRHPDVMALLGDLPALSLQENARQNRYKLSYHVPLTGNRELLGVSILQRLEAAGIRARLVWSVDAPAGVGLLDVLPASASKYHALRALMRRLGYGCDNTVFCGDSGNDLEVLVSEIPAVVVGNAEPEVQARARDMATEAGTSDRLYVATGGFLGMNGNYSAGMLEGIAHFYPHTVRWMRLPSPGVAAQEAGRSL